ncbi:MAG TPA: 4-hydroxythreonine-4-phosphate dehydrogenase PdxA [Kiritimatiellia bacterium]|nr:4-hydroxythreonine-4-phosphate dehydrogenase PdxA [Kiritimatiellia bacterium]HRZ12614.1 4-hydroxythreonine-4-phosphate dehydrogenase PdxA [Kiritimatiellia bacterium]HSA17692.1 4-hydroxythreonine-4-phosphate dehydrogenase PdxA [Kiritimatiellia bacterium]
MSAMLRIGITLGDVNGIGPEIALRAVARGGWPANVRFVLVGSDALVRAQARALRLRLPGDRVSVWDPAPALAPDWKPGRIRADASRAAGAWIRAAAAACLDGRLDAMVTAPICKEGFQKAGIHVPGHTELLAELTGTRRYAMMLFGGPLRVVLATRHLPLADVARKLKRADVLEAIRITGEALPWLGCRGGRIGVCGLNPHAGDGGAIGREEITVIAPAIRAARREGFNAVGPVPADVIFRQAVRGDFDAVVAMYHDQGLGPLKMLAFETGVNVTLGLPIVRTSPDHGTAFDIAGRGRANPSSIVEAIRQAIALTRRRNPWKK